MASLLSPGDQHPNHKFLFSAEARDRIRQLPSSTPVPLFHSRTPGGLSPSDASVTSSIYSSATQQDSASAALSSHLHRPHPRSPHDAAAWDPSLRQPTPSHPFHSFNGSGYPHPLAYDGVHYPLAPPPARPESTPHSAPFFASLAKHAPLPVLPSHSASHTPSPYGRPLHSVAVYAEFDKAWMRTPLPKSVANHPMAIAHAEASMQREEWERQQVERLRREEWQRATAEEAVTATPGTDATPSSTAKKAGAAKLGKRPALPSRRAPSAVFSSPTPASADTAFRTPLPRAKQRPPVPQSSSTQKRRIAPMQVEGDGETKEAMQAPHTAETSRSAPRPAQSTPLPSARESFVIDDQLTDDEDEAGQHPDSADIEEDAGDAEQADTDEDEYAEEVDAAADEEELEADELPVKLSPVKQRLSNRIYQSSGPPAAERPPAALAPEAEASPPLKPDLTLTRWFLHLKPSIAPSSTPTVLLKGLTPANEPWVTGYVIQRLDACTLLTKTRRYLLAGHMDEDEMQLEGWDESGLRAFHPGFPLDWEERLQQEAERRANEAFDYENEEADDEEVKEVAASRPGLSSRPHRSPAPVKAWKSSQWSEAETLRLVEAQLLHEGKEGKALWPLVAAAVGNDRTVEECRRKFEEVKREQQTTIRITQRAHPTTPPTSMAAAAPRRDADPKHKPKKPTPPKPKSRPPSTPAASSTKPTKSATASIKSKPKPKTPQAKATPSAARVARGGVRDGELEPSVTNPHDLAVAVSRRSGRAVIAPLKWWETEREINGVVLKGAQVDVRQYHEALSAKERREQMDRSSRWTKEERSELFVAYREVDPTEPHFWEEVASRIADRNADECQREFQAMYPTPKRRKRRTLALPADDEKEAEEGAEVEEEQQTRKRRKRVTTMKRELRQALVQRDAEHGADDLFDSTPYKDNAAIAAQHPHRRKLPASVNMDVDEGDDGEEELLVGDVRLADAVVQRLVKERRKTRTNLTRAREEEKKRRTEEQMKERQGDRFAESAEDVEAQLKALDDELKEREEGGVDEDVDSEEDDE